MHALVALNLREALQAAGLQPTAAHIELDPDDQDQQTLLIWYPQVTSAADGYIRAAVKIESGAKSALDPNRPAVIRPYVSDDVAGMDLNVTNVTTVVAERTFWDKAVNPAWVTGNGFERRSALRGGGQRVSRHYYDLYRLLESDTGRNAAGDFDLAADCVRACQDVLQQPGSQSGDGPFLVPSTLSPNRDMAADLARDYTAMTGMIFGEAPPFAQILDRVADFEATVNAGA